MAFSLLTTASNAQDNEIPIHDLGDRNIGQSYTLKLTGKNVDCDAPQDFEFEMEGMPWLGTDGPAIVRGLGPGQSKTIPAELDFQYTPIGTHFGRMTSRCITCGWYIFASCVDQGQDLVFKVTVVDPENTDAPVPQNSNPYAGMSPNTRIEVELEPPLSDEDYKALRSDDKKALDQQRGRLRAAQKRGENAQSNLRKAQRKKSDCERELAKLRSQSEAAKLAAKTAKQESKIAADAAEDAKDILEDFENDNKKALKKIERTKNDTLVAAKYRGLVEKEDGTGSDRYKRAQEQVDRFNEKHFDALREHTAVRNSHEQRKKSANDTVKQAGLAKTKAEQEAKRAKTAQYKYEQKLKICNRLQDEVETAQDGVADAKENARDVAKATNAAEAEAAKDAVKGYDDKIKDARNRCKAKRKAAEREVAEITRAMEAGQKLGIFEADGSRKPSKLKEINDKIWAEAEDMASDKAQALNLAPVNPAEIQSADTAEDILETVTGVLGHAASALEGSVGGVGVPDFAQSELLGGLKALGYAVQGLVAASKNPNSNFALRDEYTRGENSAFSQDLRAAGYGKDSADLAKIKSNISKLFNKKDYLADLIDRRAKEAARCVAEIKVLKRKQNALQNQIKQKK